MSDFDIDSRRAAHRRGHSVPMRKRAIDDRAYDLGAPTVSIERFAPNRVLTADNFDQALRDAVAWCYTTNTSDFAYCVELPPGVWPVTNTTLNFAGTYSAGTKTPGIIGPGSTVCKLVVHGDFTAGRGFIELGTNDYTVGQFFKGFTISAFGGNAVGIGIRAVNTFQLLMEDVRVEGYLANQHHDSGWGISFEYDDINMSNQHQHATLRSVRVSLCQSGIKFWNVAQLVCDDVWVNQCLWMSQSYSHLLGASFTGGNLQGDNDLTNGNAGARWFNRSLTPECATGWHYTTGLPSGAAATLSTTTLAADPDTGNTNVGTCTLTGLTGMSLDMVGNWIQLTAASGTPFVSDDNVSGLYRIIGYVSATSVTIAKGTNHSSHAGVTWQVCGHDGGNQIQFGGFPYHEGKRAAMLFFGRDLVTDSTYDVTGFMAYNTMVMIANRVGRVRMNSCGPVAGSYFARLSQVNSFSTDADWTTLAMDGWSRQGVVARSRGLTNIITGTWQGSKSQASRANSFVTERGGWSFDPARSDKLTLSGTDITTVKSVQDDTVTLAPEYVGSKPSYVASDAYFGGPCFNLVGGVATATKNLIGTIPAAKLPAARFQPTLLVVARLPTTGVDAGGLRRIIARATDGSRDFQVGFNDGALYAGGNYFEGYSVDLGGAGYVQIRNTADVLPHAYVVRWEMRGNGATGKAQAVDELSGATENTLSNLTRATAETWAGNTDMLLWLCKDLGATIASLYVRYVAVIPYALGIEEIDQFMDMAAHQFGVTR